MAMIQAFLNYIRFPNTAENWLSRATSRGYENLLFEWSKQYSRGGPTWTALILSTGFVIRGIIFFNICQRENWDVFFFFFFGALYYCVSFSLWFFFLVNILFLRNPSASPFFSSKSFFFHNYLKIYFWIE